MVELNKRMRRIMEESDRRHQAASSTSFEAYRRSRYNELIAWVGARRSIYLDLKYWIWLRDPDSSPFPSETRALLAALTHGVTSGRLFCPVSYPILIELMRINPLSLRLRQAELMDELSAGVALRNEFDIAEIEFCEFFRRNSPELGAVPYRVETVWCPLGQMVVEKYPYQVDLPADLMERGRKVMLDVMWERRMADYASLTGMPADPRDTAARIESERQHYPRGDQPFSKLFAAELDGVLDVLSDRIVEQLVSTIEIFGVRPTAEERVQTQAYRPVLRNLFREIVTRGLDPSAIPSLRVRSALHAAIRMDDKRPFRDNDMHDIAHSGVAVAYTDLFLTERSFAELLNRSVVAAVIGPRECRVISNIRDALAAVAKFLTD